MCLPFFCYMNFYYRKRGLLQLYDLLDRNIITAKQFARLKKRLFRRAKKTYMKINYLIWLQYLIDTKRMNETILQNATKRI